MILPEWEKGGGTMTTLDMLSGDTWTDITKTATSVGTAEIFNTKKLSDAIFMSAEIMISESSASSFGTVFSSMFDSFILQGAVYKADNNGTTYRISGEINFHEQSSAYNYRVSGKISLNLALSNNNLQVSVKEIGGFAESTGGSTTSSFKADRLRIRNIRLIFN